MKIVYLDNLINVKYYYFFFYSDISVENNRCTRAKVRGLKTVSNTRMQFRRRP